MSYARNWVLWGSFNPLHDYRFVFFIKSATTLLAAVVFKLFGVGYLQSNIVGLLFSFPTLLLLYFAIRKAISNVAALFFLVFISLNYNQIFYGRLPFLENSMNFFAFASVAMITLSQRNFSLVLAGAFLGVSIFFGKILGVIFLFPFCLLIVFCFLPKC